MNRFLITAVAAAAAISVPAFAADIGISVTIGEPGFYGRVDIGGYPPPEVIYPEPIIIERVPVYRPPIYLRVPPGHAKHWRKHCHEYNACGERVYFVRDEWYEREYVPVYRERHRHRQDEQGEDDDQDHGRDR